MSFRGRGGRRGRGRRRGRRGNHLPSVQNCVCYSQVVKETWKPVTKLGRICKHTQAIASSEDIYLFSLPVKEYQIIDQFIRMSLKMSAKKNFRILICENFFFRNFCHFSNSCKIFV